MMMLFLVGSFVTLDGLCHFFVGEEGAEMGEREGGINCL